MLRKAPKSETPLANTIRRPLRADRGSARSSLSMIRTLYVSGQASEPDKQQVAAGGQIAAQWANQAGAVVDLAVVDRDGFQEVLHGHAEQTAVSFLRGVDLRHHRHRIARVDEVHEHPVKPILMNPRGCRAAGWFIRLDPKLVDINGVQILA